MLGPVLPAGRAVPSTTTARLTRAHQRAGPDKVGLALDSEKFRQPPRQSPAPLALLGFGALQRCQGRLSGMRGTRAFPAPAQEVRRETKGGLAPQTELGHLASRRLDLCGPHDDCGPWVRAVERRSARGLRKRKATGISLLEWTIGSRACAGRDEMTASPGQATTG